MTSSDDAVSPNYKEQFNREVKVTGVKIAAKRIQEMTKKFKSIQYAKTGVKPVQPDPDGDKATKVWLIDTSNEDNITQVKNYLGEDVQVVDVPVRLTSTNFSSYEILSEILPKGTTIPSSFEAVGHIAHINLKDEHHKYRFLIGQVILDKNPGLKTVVNKLGAIGSEFREFQFELLAGKADYNATVKQHNCTFTVPYDKVYWNSRLQTEHTRLVKVVCDNENVILADVMAGIGPFAVPAAKAGVTVHANDLNPVSYEYLQKNSKQNGVSGNVTPYCLDGREFIAKIRDMFLLDSSAHQEDVHFAMNLPATAVEFLDAFLNWDASASPHRAVIHVYCFSSEKDFKEDAVRLVQHHLKTTEPLPEVSVHHVRNVAPKKEMLCVSFRLAKLKRACGEADVDKRPKLE
eukprot:TRINITY_DN12781_c0_g2_i1.p1 TRINITY_DN12781_c0_g2~~TRINITY_DN12781_c0_g2_i1.p1  ORF type:complete len:429 (+),score=76.71 TRINITY_DN12781_c0_g2_i1:78-1289(+)